MAAAPPLSLWARAHLKHTGVVDVSVIVCTFNRARSLSMTLEALDAQVTPPSLAWELLVVDNNSSDATRDAIARFAASSRIPVRYHFEGRQGLSRARNTGISLARGAVIAFTDDDVQPDAAWVASIALAMGECRADVLGGPILPLWSRPPPRWLEERGRLRAYLSIMEHDQRGQVTLGKHQPYAVWGANMAFRRDVFDRVGRFDVRRGINGTKLYRAEEHDLTRRALAAGCVVVYDPRVRVRHRIGPDRMRVAYFTRLHFDDAEGTVLAGGALPARHLCGVPPGAYRAAARALWTWLWAMVRRDPRTLDRWFALCAALGRIRGFWKRARQPADAASIC